MGLNKNTSKNYNKKAQGFPVQIVMMTILGIVLLSMGFFLTSTIFNSGNEFSADLTNQLRTNIDSRYCDGQNSLCAPPITLRGRDADIAYVNAVNLESTTKTYRLDINSDSQDRSQINASCGVLLFDAYSLEIEIQSSTSAQIPIAFSKGNINTRPCSFTTTMRLLEGGVEVPNSRKPLIIRVE
ncbi:MAG: hypothetical protein LAT82_03785 [Nanoarchaeota archaeon]|nr:hypothetical protein [Nanoarchaeota archaeon]